MYRGTSGTEVAYLVRNLLTDSGLDRRPEQVRFLAASASLDPVRDGGFLEGFFAAPQGRFSVVKGEAPAVAAVAAGDAAAPFIDRLRVATTVKGTPRARAASAIAAELYPDTADADERLASLRDALVSDTADGIRIRAHYFFRNVPGAWAAPTGLSGGG